MEGGCRGAPLYALCIIGLDTTAVRAESGLTATPGCALEDATLLDRPLPSQNVDDMPVTSTQQGRHGLRYRDSGPPRHGFRLSR